MSEKLQKVLASLGLGSRRDMEEFITQGRISVDGKVAKLGDRVGESEILRCDGRIVRNAQSEKPICRVLVYNKPEGQMCTTSDPQGRPTVFDRLPHISKSRWLYIGRLDVNTSGLLLFTTDGELANSLMHPSHEIERVYAVRVFGEVTKEHLQALQTNVELEDGPAHFDKVIYVGGEGMNQWYNVVLKEGRKREVRRLWEALGLKVSRLKRIKYGCVELGRLPVGGYEELSLQEVNDLRALAGLKPERKTMVNEEVKIETTSRDEYLKNRQIKKTFKKFATKNDYDRRSRDARRAKSGQGDKGFVSMYAQDIDYSNFSSIYAGINTNGDNRIHRTHGPHQSQDNRRGSRSQAWGKDNSFDRNNKSTGRSKAPRRNQDFSDVEFTARGNFSEDGDFSSRRSSFKGERRDAPFGKSCSNDRRGSSRFERSKDGAKSWGSDFSRDENSSKRNDNRSYKGERSRDSFGRGHSKRQGFNHSEGFKGRDQDGFSKSSRPRKPSFKGAKGKSKFDDDRDF